MSPGVVMSHIAEGDLFPSVTQSLTLLGLCEVFQRGTTLCL